MSRGEILTPAEAQPFYATQIAPAYQVAFGKESRWEEETKCADPEQRCIGGFSPLEAGSECGTCGRRVTEPAYPTEELVERFNALAKTRATRWYVERIDDDAANIAFAALAWAADAAVIAEEKYTGDSQMAAWLASTLPEEGVVWLDEAFGNLKVRPKGNLKNFGRFITGFAQELGSSVVAYRTIEPRMTAVAARDFGERTAIYTRGKDVPDRRDFVIIDLREEQS